MIADARRGNRVCPQPDQWQLLFLIEILLVTLLAENPLVAALSMPTLLSIYSTTGCEIVKVKVVIVWMLVMQVTRDERCEASQCLQRFSLPERLPPYERSNFMIYLMGTLTAIASLEFRAFLLRALLRLFNPNEKEKKYMANYEANLHCRGEDSEAEISLPDRPGHPAPAQRHRH